MYALMSSIQIALPSAGWNMFAYPVTGFSAGLSRPCNPSAVSTPQSMAAIQRTQSTPGKLYCPAAPDWVNDLEVLEFGRGYWINVSQPITIGLKGSSATLAAPATANGCGFVPPATYYGTLKPGGGFSPASGVSLTAWIDGHLCGQALTREQGGQIVFSLDVPVEDVTANPGCGAPGRRVTFQVGDQDMLPAITWDNNQVTNITLRHDSSVDIYICRI